MVRGQRGRHLDLQYSSERAVGQPTRSAGLLRQGPSASPRTLHVRSWRLKDQRDLSLQKSRTHFSWWRLLVRIRATPRRADRHSSHVEPRNDQQHRP